MLDLELDPSRDRLLRMKDLQQVLPLSSSRLYQLVAAGRLAPPVRIGLNAVAWKASDVRAYLDLLTAEQVGRQAGVLNRRGPLPKASPRTAIA